MTKNALKQFECKNADEGELLYNTEFFGNVLLFVSSGKLMISNEKATPITEIEEGYFALLPAEKCHLVTAVTRAETIIMYASQLSEFITEDPKWNPDLPVVLPIFPSLARTLYLLKESQKEKQNSLN